MFEMQKNDAFYNKLVYRLLGSVLSIMWTHHAGSLL